MSYDNKNSRSIEDEVRKLFKSNNGKISNHDFVSLRQKYQDVDIVEKIQQEGEDLNFLQKSTKLLF